MAAPAGGGEKPPTPETTEGSIIGRFVAIVTPIFAAGAAWLSGFAAKEWGIELNKGEIVAFMIAVATAVLGSGWKWLQGLQAHEQRVAEGKALPMRKAKQPLDPRTKWFVFWK